VPCPALSPSLPCVVQEVPNTGGVRDDLEETDMLPLRTLLDCKSTEELARVGPHARAELFKLLRHERTQRALALAAVRHARSRARLYQRGACVVPAWCLRDACVVPA
jgi:hypothetical protein